MLVKKVIFENDKKSYAFLRGRGGGPSENEL